MVKKIELLILIVLIAGCSSACKFTLPTSPDFSDSEKENGVVKSKWDPYVGVHAFSFSENLQQPHLLKLINTGMLKGVRIENLGIPDVQYFSNWFQNNGVEVLGLFENERLRDPDVCQIFGQYVVRNPGVIYWEIGNEVNYIGMSPREYVGIVAKLFYYAKQNYPGIKIVSGGIGGNVAAADALRQMIDAGLDKLCQDGLEVVAIHFYSWSAVTRVAEFKSQIMRLPAHVRVFITETNTMPPSWDNQIEYVKNVYPKLRDALRAERIYWYAFCGNGDFSLVMMNTWEYSPLMKLLIGFNGRDDSYISGEESVALEQPFNDLPGFRDHRYPPEERRKTSTEKAKRRN